MATSTPGKEGRSEDAPPQDGLEDDKDAQQMEATPATAGGDRTPPSETMPSMSSRGDSTGKASRRTTGSIPGDGEGTAAGCLTRRFDTDEDDGGTKDAVSAPRSEGNGFESATDTPAYEDSSSDEGDKSWQSPSPDQRSPVQSSTLPPPISSTSAGSSNQPRLRRRILGTPMQGSPSASRTRKSADASLSTTRSAFPRLKERVPGGRLDVLRLPDGRLVPTEDVVGIRFRFPHASTG